MNRGTAGKFDIAVVSSIGQPSNNASYAVPSSGSNYVAVTLSKKMEIGQLGDVLFDVSKSSTLYANKYQIGSTVPLLDQSGSFNSVQGADLIETLAFGAKQNLTIRDAGLNESVYFNYAGLGYQNPGNNGYGGAKMKLGGNVKKSLYKNKLSIGLRSEIKSMPISYTSNDQWKNFMFQLDSKYLINKIFNLSTKYMVNSTEKSVYGVISPVYSFHRFQIDGNARYKLGNNYTQSHISIGAQSFNNTYISQSAGQSYLLNFSQSLLLRRSSLIYTFFSNKDASPYKLIGDLITSDLTYQYLIFRKINMSSGMTYLNNSGIANQIGIRQSVQLFSTAHFDMDTYLDLRKDIVPSLNPGLYGNCNAEISLKYHLN